MFTLEGGVGGWSVYRHLKANFKLVTANRRVGKEAMFGHGYLGKGWDLIICMV